MGRGFTLIELLIVVLIGTVLLTLAGPSFVDMLDRRRLVSQAEAVHNLVQVARMEAARHSTVNAGSLPARSVTLTVKPAAPWYVGLRAGTGACDGSAASCAVNEGGTAVTRLVTASDCTGCTLSSPSAQTLLTFTFRGLVEPSNGMLADTLITLRSPRGKELRVAVSPIGRAALCSPSGSVSGYPSC